MTPVKAFFTSFHARGWILLFQSYIWVVRGWEETEIHRNTREHQIFLSSQHNHARAKRFQFQKLARLSILDYPGTVANLSQSSTFSVLFKLWLHQFGLYKRVMKRKATQGDNIHPLRLRRKDTRISYSTLALMNKIISIFFFYFVNGNQSWLQCASLIIHRTSGWALLQLNFPSFFAFLSSACWEGDANWSPRGQTRQFLVNTITLWQWGSLQIYITAGTYETSIIQLLILNANLRCVTLILTSVSTLWWRRDGNSCLLAVDFCVWRGSYVSYSCWNRQCWILISCTCIMHRPEQSARFCILDSLIWLSVALFLKWNYMLR